mmetsp:Transcript_5637/g.12280  ORF Transcript_5637/g.12280 Transcript_5637/m.12280 type:complete len:153 (+) Transcript_5637:428-886(+)
MKQLMKKRLKSKVKAKTIDYAKSNPREVVQCYRHSENPKRRLALQAMGIKGKMTKDETKKAKASKDKINDKSNTKMDKMNNKSNTKMNKTNNKGKTNKDKTNDKSSTKVKKTNNEGTTKSDKTNHKRNTKIDNINYKGKMQHIKERFHTKAA